MTETKVSMYMRWYVGDYLADTDHLSLEEHGAYSLLLMKMWQREGVLPLDHDVLARLCRVSRKDWDRIWPVIRPLLILIAEPEKPDSISQKRLVVELLAAKARCEKATTRGKKGGEAKRALGLEQAETKLRASREQVESKLEPSRDGALLEVESKHGQGSPLELAGQGSGVRGQEESPSARDPDAPEPDGVLKKCTGFDLCRWYGLEREGAIEGTQAWQTPAPTEGKAETFADRLSPEEIRDVRPTMRLHFAELKAGRGPMGAKENPTYGFGCWVSSFTMLRERLRLPEDQRQPPRPMVSAGSATRPGAVNPQVAASVAAMGDRAAARYET
jgi:uncharacterized protein YdaU (DUF1376 family)